jgi:hypothetical protein
MIRRHTEEAQVILRSSGELVRSDVEKSEHKHADERTSSQRTKSQQSPDPANTLCNHIFKEGEQDKDVCLPSHPDLVAINNQALCEKAANVLNRTYGGTVNDDWMNPLVFPHQCFVMKTSGSDNSASWTAGHVYYNPTQTSPGPSAYQGQTVCVEEKYPLAGHGGTCPTGFEKITNFAACKTAWSCSVGFDGCESDAMNNNNPGVISDAPQGCYSIAGTGCYDYNTATNSNWPGQGNANHKYVCHESSR